MKKGLIIGMVLVVLILSGLLFGSGCSCGKDGDGGQTTRVVCPNGQIIEIIGYEEVPPELQISLEERAKAGNFDDIVLSGTAKNVASQKVDFLHIRFNLDGGIYGYSQSWFYPFEPGEERGFEILIPPHVWEGLKFLEVKVIDFRVLEGQPTTPKTPAKPEEPEGPEAQLFYHAPKNPKSPAEVVAAWAFYCDAKQYDKAEELCTEKFIKENGSPERLWRYISDGASLTKVEITYENANEEETRAGVDAIFHFSNGRQSTSRPRLIEENGDWKLNQ